MRRYGLATNPKKVYLSNFDFFDAKNECEEQFYWAGFIAADGCMKHRVINNKQVYQLDIGLSEKDSSHLEKFKKNIKSECPISKYLIKNSKINPKWNDVYKAQITITNKKIFDDLARFNVVPRKTKIYTFPEWLINHEMVNHFMRGYFDGDGSFYKTLKKNRKTEQLYFSLRGTQEFLKVYRSILEDKCNLDIREKDIRVNCSIGVLEYGGNGILKQIAEYLYRDSTVYLDRKYDLIKPFII